MTDLLKVYNSMNFEGTNNEGMAMNGRVLIVDGLNTFIRNFAANPTMDDNGNHIGGITGFLKSIGLAIRTLNPSRVTIVFDGKGGSKRKKQIYPEYKGHRKPLTRLNRAHGGITDGEPEKDFMKMELILLAQILEYLPVDLIAYDYVEADDVMAYVAKLVEEEGGEAILYSTDKDFLQLVNEQITVWNPATKKTYDVERICEEHDIHPNNFLLYRALTGDKSDNINGIKGVGKKTMLKLLPQMTEETKVELSEVMGSAQSSGSKAAVKILENEDIIRRNFKLMRLDETNFSADNKLSCVDILRSPPPRLRKLDLTKFLVQHNIMPAMGNFQTWINDSFNKLDMIND
ncbi:MAG: 5'-3' exonuclease H3TH domain-containing protein [Betaproteobacteria bacterium]|jgi:DNA polymerase-1